MPKLSYEDLAARCTQLQSDNNATVNQAEDAKKTLDEISAKTWDLVVKILSTKNQTPDQAVAELKATGHISDEVFKNIEAGTSGLERVQNIELWFTGIVNTSIWYHT
ncbi:hypothetical protein MPER_09300 [Moniliophthora perniciosa FA553]|nr:hypothetical protein MPER_09300 [Moniliophthora perniciosa FA553]